MLQLGIREFNKNITKWLNSGKRIVITKNGEPLVKIIPVATQGIEIEKKEVLTDKVVATPKKEIKVATKNPFEICKKHGIYRKSCGCL